jgi:hypothetical protein
LAERLVVEPSKAHGLWIEFVGPPSAPADGRYLVTSSALHLGLRIRLCVAVDPRDPQGVWWWGPGASGCDSRATGPSVFHAHDASVSRSAAPEVTAISFRVGTHSLEQPFLDVRLAIEDGRMRSLDTGDVVALQRRSDLEVPEKPPRL